MGMKITVECPGCKGSGDVCGTMTHYSGVEVEVEGPCYHCDGDGEIEVDKEEWDRFHEAVCEHCGGPGACVKVYQGCSFSNPGWHEMWCEDCSANSDSLD